MDWANEKYVRWYTRDTKTWFKLGWEGQCVLGLLLRKVDRAGVLEGAFDAADLCLMFANGIPEEVVEVGLVRLLNLDVISKRTSGIVVPNFIEAQETAQSDRQRAKKCREKRRDESRFVTSESQAVTPSHAESHDVTLCCAVPSCAVPSCAEKGLQGEPPPLALTPPAQVEPKRRRSVEIPKPMSDTWSPPPALVDALATRYSVSRERINSCVPEWRLYWISDGKVTTERGWASTLSNWIGSQAKNGKLYAAGPEPKPRTVWNG